jgi:hypothetical protein
MLGFEPNISGLKERTVVVFQPLMAMCRAFPVISIYMLCLLYLYSYFDMTKDERIDDHPTV